MPCPDGYPPDWPRCPGCGRAALDGHITCGEAVCDEGEQRRHARGDRGDSVRYPPGHEERSKA